MDATDKEAVKKPYHSPKVFVYGNIRELTETNWTGTGMRDSGYSTNQKTG